MILFKKKAGLQQFLAAERAKGKTLGFVPTMGALHQGHLSLIEKSRQENTLTIASIFVNPTQFNDPKDFEKYPVTIEKDLYLLESAGCDVLLLPSVREVYPSKPGKDEHYDLGYLETVLEGKFRPGHFQGVCQVVSRLLEMAKPDKLYLGQKDYQQCMVLTRLVELMGLASVITVKICPTLREADGLAMSSRNLRLNEHDRAVAPAVYAALSTMKENLRPGDLSPLKAAATDSLIVKGFRPDYVEIADGRTLEIVTTWDGKRELVALVAAFLGEVRLIDNLIITDK